MRIILIQKHIKEIIETGSDNIMPTYEIAIHSNILSATNSNDMASEITDKKVRKFNLIAYNKNKTTGIYVEAK